MEEKNWLETSKAELSMEIGVSGIDASADLKEDFTLFQAEGLAETRRYESNTEEDPFFVRRI